ncbi:MAG: RHS repeat protein, partial [Phycisphaerales bacterium]|nr:RHS repeat protein [Hyphomonadaceae bacterium]
MVAIFTGLGVGFERGSAAALGSGGLLGSSSLGRGLEGVFLNAANGNLVLQRQDEFLVGRGPDASIARTYNSQGALDEDGDDWRYSTDRRVFELTGTLGATGSSVKRVSADGSVITYKWNGSLYIAKEGSGAHDTLQHTAAVTGPPAVPAYWTWTEGSSQIKETYTEAESGVFRIKTQRDGDANTITFHYNSSDPTKLERVETADGGYTAYVWTGAHITKVETYVTGGLSTPSLTRTYYAYDSEDRLASVTVDLSPEDNSTASGGAYTITYGYDGTSNRVTSISQSDGSLLTIGYIYDSGSLSFRVTSLAQTVATGDTRTTNIEYFAGRTEITDARGQVTKLYFEISDTDNLSQLKQVVAPAAYTGATPQEIDYAYDSDGNLTSVTDAMDHVTSYQYDASGNVTKITNANGNVTDRAYDSANNLTLETFTGATANSAAATLYRRFVYDGENHLRFSISADGNVTEYRYTGPGELEYAITYPDDDYATGSSVPTLTDMETWRDGLANRATTQIVKYIYDTRGNLSDTYGYSGATNAGVADASKGYVRTHTVRDQSGRLLSRFVEGQATESFVYDGLGRVLLSTDLAGGVTKIAFTDATTTTVVTTNVAYNSGTSSWDATTWSLTSTSVYNKAGERTGHTEAGLHVYGGTATYLYDKNGQLRRATDARGHKSYFIYDKTGRKVADVGADGQLVEYRYDQAGRVVATTR